MKVKWAYLHWEKNDKWKKDFLLKIEEQGIPTKTYVDDNKYKIIGLPFFNREFRMEEFDVSLKILTGSEKWLTKFI